MEQSKPSLASPLLPGMPQMPRTPTDSAGQMFTAALLEAVGSKCQCATCRVLRKIAGRLKTQLLQGVEE